MPKRMSRPSPALVISLIALFVALGGTGYAAVKINGKNLKNKSIVGKKLKNKTITGAKLKSNTLTGTQINESKLGTVPSATNATNATNAVNATNSSNTSGRLHVYKRVTATPGANTTVAMAAAPESKLFEVGPFTIYGKCFTDTSGPATFGYMFVKTSEGNSVLNALFAPGLYGVPAYLQPGTTELQRFINLAAAGANQVGIAPPTIDQVYGSAPSGTAFEATTNVTVKNGTPIAGNGPFGAGDACLFSGALNRLN